MSNCIFKVLRSGINTTYQDEGRFGLQHLGIPPGGCMDHKSYLFAKGITRLILEDSIIALDN